MGVRKLQVVKVNLISEIERIGNFEVTEPFFETEKKMLNHLYKLEKEEAQHEARRLLDYITEVSAKEKFTSIKYYCVIFSAIVTRYLEQNHLTSSKAYGFNVGCIRYIERNLTENNANEIIDELIEFFAYVLADQKLPSLRHNTVNDVILYINEDIESSVTVEGIAKKFDVSTSHLSRIFREHSGITLVEYINIRKVEESQYYLRFSDKNIAGISEQFNFCNQSYFTRIFKKYTGETPRRFRHNIASDYFRFTLPGEQ